MGPDRVVPFGAWPSPLTPDTAANGAPRYGDLALGRDVHGEPVLWFSTLEDAENVLWRAAGGVAELVTQVRSARSRVNEYGGGSFWVHGDTLFWVDAEDQCIRRLDSLAADPVRLTDPGPRPRVLRYSAGVVEPGGSWMVVERELHLDDAGAVLGEPINDIAWLPTDPAGVPGVPASTPCAVVAGPDFCAAPALSPSGDLLAWLQWDHPEMPWDAAELWVGRLEVDAGGPQLRQPRRVAGGAVGDTTIAACLPSWSPDGRLWWCDDRDDLWSLRGAPAAGLPGPGVGDDAPSVFADIGEVGVPRWVSAQSRYGFGEGFLAAAEIIDGLDRVIVADHDPSRWPQRQDAPQAPPPALSSVSYVDSLVVHGEQIAAIAGTATALTSVVIVGPQGSHRYHDDPWPLGEGSISVPEPITFPTPAEVATPTSSDGIDSPASEAHGLFYPPALEGVAGPDGDRPPLVVRIHGGPTACARAELTPSVQFWTTRGFAVLEVNHRGSTGFGRTYRNLLRGGWGAVEVQDCIAGAEYLASGGRVDPLKCVIRGGSAGGFTALEAVSAPPSPSGFHFAAATTLYGVTDLMALAQGTHKFESRYLDSLVGPLPDAEPVYRERSPLFHPERIGAPVLILQGLDDPIVPPEQAEVLVAALEETGVDHEYRAYPGEGHGFRATVHDGGCAGGRAGLLPADPRIVTAQPCTK